MPGEEIADHHGPPDARPSGDVFRVDTRRVVICLVMASSFAILGLLIIAAGILVDFPEPVISKRVMALLMGGVVLLIAVILFVQNWKRYGRWVELTTHGFHFHAGRQTADVHWDDVIAVRRESTTIGGSPALSDTNLWIERSGGKTIHLTSFLLDMPRLADIVLTETARRLIPRVWSQLQSGQAVNFGPLRITATELTTRGRDLAWSDVESMDVIHGSVRITQQGDTGIWLYAAIKTLPNYHVLLAVAERLLNGESA